MSYRVQQTSNACATGSLAQAIARNQTEKLLLPLSVSGSKVSFVKEMKEK